MKVTLIGAASRDWGARCVRDVLLSKPLAEDDLELVLMDIQAEPLEEMEAYAHDVVKRLNHSATVTSTTDLDKAVEGARFVVTAIESDRYHYWSQDFHLPRKYGFKQVYGENGGPGSLFHALRQIPPLLEIARTMERLAPGAVLLNFSNPEHKVVEAISRLTSVQAVGLCHGYFMGANQISTLLDIPLEDLDLAAGGINHFQFFQRIRDRKTGEDLYPRLREIEKNGNWVSDWHEIALSRILFRRFGLWPSPGGNHIGEYLSWAHDFVPTELQYFYDPAQESPWHAGGKTPEWYYTIDHADTKRGFLADPPASWYDDWKERPLEASNELAAPIMEAIAYGVDRDLPAVNIPNRGAIPGLPDDMVVEVAATAQNGILVPVPMERFPEAITASFSLQGSIHKLLVEAFVEESKDKLLQAVLLDPVVDSYPRAVAMVDEFVHLQRDILPALR
jgi:alpha-galactosidase